LEFRNPLPVKGRPVKVQGTSMSPYLRENDVLWVEEESTGSPCMGQLVLAQKRSTGEIIVHRYLAFGQIKGDRSREIDDQDPGELKILGIISGRVEAGSSKWITYQRPLVANVHRVQALLSMLNQSKLRGVNRLASGALRLLGGALRVLEERLP
jgi:hypothetical protein